MFAEFTLVVTVFFLLTDASAYCVVDYVTPY